MEQMKGQTLVEVLIALALASVVLSSLAVIVLSALRNATIGNSQTLANTYAQQGIETMRTMRNTNYTSFNNLGNTHNYYCLANGCSGVSDSTAGGNCGYATTTPLDTQNCSTVDANNKFYRMIQVKNASAINDCQPSTPNGLTEVYSTVYWSDNKCSNGTQTQIYCHQVQLTTCLSNVLPGH